MTGLTFPECPRWHDGRLYFSDFFSHQVLAVTSDGKHEVLLEIDDWPAGLGFRPDGDMLIVSMRRRRLLRWRRGSAELVADLSSLASFHLNDMAVDDRGGAFVGCFGFDPYRNEPVSAAPVLRVEPDGSARIAANGLIFPNGCVITNAGRTLLVAETFGNRISAFDVDAGNSLANRREWTCFGPPCRPGSKVSEARLEVQPDGIAIDAEGALWIADAGAARVLLVRAGGEVVDSIHVPGFTVYGVALGGDDGRDLYMCGVRAGTFDAKSRPGVVMTCRVGVPGIRS